MDAVRSQQLHDQLELICYNRLNSTQLYDILKIIEKEKQESYLLGYSIGYKEGEKRAKDADARQRVIDQYPPGTRIFTHGGPPIALEAEAPDFFPWIKAIMAYDSNMMTSDAVEEYRKRFKKKD